MENVWFVIVGWVIVLLIKMNNTCAILWYDKEVKDTLMEIQIFNSEEEARKFLKDAQSFVSYPKIVPNLSVFVQNEEGVLLKK